MAEKLKSILRRIHWSSLLKAAIFAASWLLLPYWLFIIIALFLYFRPWFRVGTLIGPFFALLVLTDITAPGFFVALIFGALFYLTLLIKDLLILDRRSAYEVLILGIALVYARHFYAAFADGVSGVAFFWAFVVAGMITLLFRNFTSAFMGEKAIPPDESVPAMAAATAKVAENGKNETPVLPAVRQIDRVAAWLIFLLSTQVIIAGLFLPLDFIYQSVIVFLILVLLVDLIGEYIFGGLNRNKILGVGNMVFTLLVIILASARWWL